MMEVKSTIWWKRSIIGEFDVNAVRDSKVGECVETIEAISVGK